MCFRSGNFGFLFLAEKSRARQAGGGHAQVGGLGEAGEVEHGAGDGRDLTGQPLDGLRLHLVDVAHVVDDVDDVLQFMVHLTYWVNLGRRGNMQK